MTRVCRSRYTIFATSVEERATAEGEVPAQVVAAMEQERMEHELGVSSYMTKLNLHDKSQGEAKYRQRDLQPQKGLPQGQRPGCLLTACIGCCAMSGCIIPVQLEGTRY